MKINDLHFSNHLIQRIKERNLKIEWIRSTVREPDEQVNISDEEIYFYKIITQFHNKWLKVVINGKKRIIVTAYFDRNKKG